MVGRQGLTRQPKIEDDIAAGAIGLMDLGGEDVGPVNQQGRID